MTNYYSDMCQRNNSLFYYQHGLIPPYKDSGHAPNFLRMYYRLPHHGPLAKGAGTRILYVCDVTEGLALCAVLSTHEIELYLRR